MNKREKEVIQLQLEAEEDILAELEKQYKRALKDIEDKIKFLQTDELTQSRIYQIQYQQALKGQIEGIIEKLHSDGYTSIQQFLNNAYTDAFVATAYDLAGQGIPLIMPIDQNAAVKAIITDSKIKEDLYTALGVDAKALKKSIRQEITRGIASGMHYQDIARNIKEASNAPLSRAKTIARTESHRIQQASTYDAQTAAKKRGADVVKQWDSTLDGRTRSTHRHLDGQIKEVEEPFEMDGKKAMFPGEFGDPGEDCNCRCVSLTRARWALDDDELKTLQERAEFFGLDKTEDFADYKKKYLKAAEETNLSEGFVPAKTIEEAEEYAKQFVVDKVWDKNGEISYKGLSVDAANKMNKALTELYDKFDLPKLQNLKPMPFREKRWKIHKDAVLAYDSTSQMSGGLFFNPNFVGSKKKIDEYIAQGLEAFDICKRNMHKLAGEKLALVERHVKAGRSLVVYDTDDYLESFIQHEMGHHIHQRIMVYDKVAAEIIENGFETYAINISGYASNSYGEYVAESFCAYMNGEVDRIDPALKKYFEGLVK